MPIGQRDTGNDSFLFSGMSSLPVVLLSMNLYNSLVPRPTLPIFWHVTLKIWECGPENEATVNRSVNLARPWGWGFLTSLCFWLLLANMQLS